MRVRDAAVVLLFSATIAPSGDAPCTARSMDGVATPIRWVDASADAAALERWCRAVGPPVYQPSPAKSSHRPPALEDLVVVTWNAHLSEGRLRGLVEGLRSGALTGEPVERYVVLAQEIVRRGPSVPAFETGMRSAHAIRATMNTPDVHGYAASLGLSVLYVPSMRNGPELREDRGNAIFSTEPLSNALAVELPLQRQRRVAIGASIMVDRDGVAATLQVMNAHLEPLSSPRSLWFFRDPRREQMAALLGVLASWSVETDVGWAGTVLGGDMNLVRAGIDERAYQEARAWGHSVSEEDRRATHVLGRLDYLFVRLADGWSATIRRADQKFGSDHYPVFARFMRAGVRSGRGQVRTGSGPDNSDPERVRCRQGSVRTGSGTCRGSNPYSGHPWSTLAYL